MLSHRRPIIASHYCLCLSELFMDFQTHFAVPVTFFVNLSILYIQIKRPIRKNSLKTIRNLELLDSLCDSKNKSLTLLVCSHFCPKKKNKIQNLHTQNVENHFSLIHPKNILSRMSWPKIQYLTDSASQLRGIKLNPGPGSAVGVLDGSKLRFSLSALWFQSASALVPIWVWLVLRIHMWTPFSRPYKIHAQTLGSAIVFNIQKQLERNMKLTGKL